MDRERYAKRAETKIQMILARSQMPAKDRDRIMGYVRGMRERIQEVEEDRAAVIESVRILLDAAVKPEEGEGWKRERDGHRTESQEPEDAQTASGGSTTRICVSAQGANSSRISLRMISYARNGKNIFREKEEGGKPEPEEGNG